jgi:hypothetical protein
VLDTLALPTFLNPLLLGDSPAHGAVLGRHLVTVPALPPMAGTLRAAVGDLLAEHPRRTDAQQIINEFATTAIIEQRCDCCPHDQITLTVDCDENRIRLEINYHLTLSHAPVWRTDEYEDPVKTYGLGLAIINNHVDDRIDYWGHMARGLDGEARFSDLDQTWYAELGHTPPTASSVELPSVNEIGAIDVEQSASAGVAEQYVDDLIDESAGEDLTG